MAILRVYGGMKKAGNEESMTYSKSNRIREMTNMNKIAMAIKAIKNIILSELFNLQRPIQVSFAVTNRCNLKCIYCYGEYFYRKQTDFTLEELKRIFDYLKKKGAVQIYLTGGEPLLRTDFDDIVNYLKKLKFNIGIVTNGILIPHKLDILKKFDHILLSIDGDKESNDKNRGKGTFEKIINAMELLKKNKIPFYLKTVFNKNNYKQLDYVLDLAKKYNTTLETILPYENCGKKSTHLNLEEKKELMNKILKYKKQNEPIKFSYAAHKTSTEIFLKYKKSIVYDKDIKKYPKCIAGKLYLFIDANGDVYPCNQLIGDKKFKPLNIHKVGIKKAIKNTLNKKCAICCIPFLNEKNYLFSLNMKDVFNKFKEYGYTLNR